MRRAADLVAIGLLPLVAVSPAAAQAPTCEDSLRAMRALAEQLSVSRQRGEADMAQAVAALTRQIEGLQAQVRALEAEKAKAAKPEPTKETK